MTTKRDDYIEATWAAQADAVLDAMADDAYLRRYANAMPDTGWQDAMDDDADMEFAEELAMWKEIQATLRRETNGETK